MIQINSFLNIVDNSGGRKACCIRIVSGYKRSYAYVGDTILISIKSLRTKRRNTSKVKKGELYQALVVRTNSKISQFTGDSLNFLENSVILLNKKNKLVGTRIFGSIPYSFRYTKNLRIINLAAGTV